MIEIRDKSVCCGCSACEQICPIKCISMVPDSEGFLYPHIREEVCLQCNLCSKICPVLNKNNKSEKYVGAYLGFANDASIKMSSSSGGLFSVLGIHVLNQGGILYGASFDKRKMVCHIRIDSISDLELLKGSKYLQSEIKDTFIKAKADLDHNRLVLYSGTACQISGLKKYLGKDYENLYTVDVLCHGVPSPLVWKEFLKWVGKGYDVKGVSFRDKSTGWNAYSVKINLENGKVCQQVHDDNIYMQMFLENICLRPSCHHCKFKEIERDSDITIGDAWDGNDKYPEMFDDAGTSVIITHTSKGEQLLMDVKTKATICKVVLDDILPTTADSRKSVKEHANRSKFFKTFNICGKYVFDLWKWDKCYHRVKLKIKSLKNFFLFHLFKR